MDVAPEAFACMMFWHGWPALMALAFTWLVALAIDEFLDRNWRGSDLAVMKHRSGRESESLSSSSGAGLSNGLPAEEDSSTTF